MSKSSQHLAQLRSRAEAALQQGESTLAHLADVTTDQSNAHELFENLRVYQVELELQHQELISAHAQAEHERERYANLFQLLPLPALIIDGIGVIQEVNQQAVDFFGFRSQRTLLQHSMFRLLHDRGGEWLVDTLHRHHNTPHQVIPDQAALHGDGRTVPIDVHLIRLPLEYAQDAHTLILLIDRSADQAHSQQRLLLESLLSNSTALIYAFDRDDRCILINERAAQLLAVDAKKALNQRRDQWMHPAYADDFRCRDRRVLNTGNPESCEEQLQTHNKPTQHFITNRFPLRDRKGDVFGVGVIANDVTETRNMALQLQLALQVFSKGTEGIIICDHNNRIISVNKAFESITGYTESEVMGCNPSIMGSGRHNAEFHRAIWESINTRGAWEGEIWNRRKGGELYPQWLNISRVTGDMGETTHYIGVFKDITQRKLAEEQIERLAFYDVLTNTPNRYLLKDRVNQAIRTSRRSHNSFALMFIDLDRFKEINDVFGHEVGDQVLLQVTQRLRELIRETDTLCRLGGDEFALLFTNLDKHNAHGRAETLLNCMSQPFTVGNKELMMSLSVGLAMFPEDGEDYDTLLKNADTAMYQAKASGRNAYRFFNVAMAQQVERRLSIESALREAIERDELFLVYQPQVCLNTGYVIGVEALLRWNNPELGTIRPDVFIPIAEESRLIVPLGDWVLQEATQHMRQWQQAGLPPFKVGVNLSAVQFWKEDFPDRLADLLAQAEVPADLLELELTERTAMRNPAEATVMMQRLRATGIRLSIDDFGTGYSSLAYLKRFPLDNLKIDKSFVQDISIDQDDEAICHSIIQLARALSLQVIAEGVETQIQAHFLRDLGCSGAQGYYYSKPLTADALADWMRQQPFVQAFIADSSVVSVCQCRCNTTRPSDPSPQTGQ